MANKTIFQLPASGALASTDELEKQVTAGGQSQKLTLAQMLTFIEVSATLFFQNIAVGNITLNQDGSAVFSGGVFTIDASGNLAINGNISLQADGSASFAGGGILLQGDGSASFAGLSDSINSTGALNVTSISTPGDIEISATASGLILTAPDLSQWRLKVDAAGNLGTEAA